MSERDDSSQIMEDADDKGGSGGFVGVFIKRPIFASVLSLLIIIAGLAALMGVEVRELPEIDQPVVTVRTDYPGATPESIDAQVTAIIENAVSQVEGVTSISSDSSFGRSRVVAEFSPNVDINIAASDVKNAVSSAQRDLPEQIEPPTVVKADSDASPIMRLVVAAPGMSEGDLGDLIDRIIVPRLQAVEGVASVDPYGVRRRVLRVRLNPIELAARSISVEDVANLVSNAMIEAPSGTLKSARQELLIRTEAPAVTPREIGALRLNDRTTIADVAVVEWDVEHESTLSRYNGAPAAGIGVLRQAQSNTVVVAAGVRQAIEDLKSEVPPNVHISVATDDSVFIKRAIEEVLISLSLSILIVIGVIFLFLRSIRTTLIPTLAIPISLLGTIAAIWLAGFSVNILTLLALVMSTGLVVDDAIVVTENVQRWRGKGFAKRAAAVLGAREIVFAVIATTATLAAVFVPISFMPGQAGRLFSEFGFVLAFAVLISAFVALTLCPMLTAKVGTDKHLEHKEQDLLVSLGTVAKRFYESTLQFVLNAPRLVFGAAIAFAVGAVLLFHLIPKELTPTEDRGRIFAMVTVQQSANFDYLNDKVAEVERRLQPLVDRGDATGIQSLTGLGSSNRAFVILRLKEWGQRKHSQQELEAEIRPALSSIPGATVQLRNSNSLGIRGAGQGLRFAVAGEDYGAAAEVAEKIAARLEQNPIFGRARLDFEVSQPQLNVKIDRDAAARLGVDVKSVTTLLSAMADEYKASQIFVGDKIIDVYLSGGGQPVDDPSDLENLFVKTRDGTFAPLSLIGSIQESSVAARLSREERRRAVPVTASLAEGAALGDAVRELRKASTDILPPNMSILLLGEARILNDSSNTAWIVFAFAGLIVLLVLAAQFESFISAIVIMATVPFGLAAAVYAIVLTGGSFNYYSQIGLVLLIGIMAKNGILVVEFANQLRDQGVGVREAVEEAALTRLRPVVMTALSTVFGGFPLILGSGAGAESRAALGWVVVGGLGFATIFTLFLTPAAYLLMARFATTRAHEGELVEQEIAEGMARQRRRRLRAAE